MRVIGCIFCGIGYWLSQSPPSRTTFYTVFTLCQALADALHGVTAALASDGAMIWTHEVLFQG